MAFTAQSFPILSADQAMVGQSALAKALQNAQLNQQMAQNAAMNPYKLQIAQALAQYKPGMLAAMINEQNAKANSETLDSSLPYAKMQMANHIEGQPDLYQPGSLIDQLINKVSNYIGGNQQGALQDNMQPQSGQGGIQSLGGGYVNNPNIHPTVPTFALPLSNQQKLQNAATQVPLQQQPGLSGATPGLQGAAQAAAANGDPATAAMLDKAAQNAQMMGNGLTPAENADFQRLSAMKQRLDVAGLPVPADVTSAINAYQNRIATGTQAITADDAARNDAYQKEGSVAKKMLNQLDLYDKALQKTGPLEIRANSIVRGTPLERFSPQSQDKDVQDLHTISNGLLGLMSEVQGVPGAALRLKSEVGAIGGQLDPNSGLQYGSLQDTSKNIRQMLNGIIANTQKSSQYYSKNHNLQNFTPYEDLNKKQQQQNAQQQTVQLKRLSDGKIAAVPADKVDSYLSTKRFARVG